MKELNKENYKTVIKKKRKKEMKEGTMIMERYPMFINLILLKYP